MKYILPLMFLVACTEIDKEYDKVNAQIKTEHKGSYCKEVVWNISECFSCCNCNSRATISCKFYDAIKME